MEDINGIIERLMELIDQKAELFDNIMEITLKQKKDIEENEANNIGELVKHKQSTIDSIDEIDKLFSEGLNLLKRQLKVNTLEEADSTKYPMLKNLKVKVEEIMLLAQKIMQIEESNKEKLVSIMNGLKKEMKHLSVGKRSIKAYEKPNINNDGVFIDKKK